MTYRMTVTGIKMISSRITSSIIP